MWRFLVVVVVNVGCRDCLDKMFIEVRHTGLGMMRCMFESNTSFFVALGELFNLSEFHFVPL